MILLSWLQGARRLYARFVRPPLLRYQPHIDETLQQLHATLVRAAPGSSLCSSKPSWSLQTLRRST